MKEFNNCKTDQLIGKLIQKGDFYYFVSTSLNDFENGKCKIDEWTDNIIFDFFVPPEEWDFLNSLQDGDMVTYFINLPYIEKGVKKLTISDLIDKGLKY